MSALQRAERLVGHLYPSNVPSYDSTATVNGTSSSTPTPAGVVYDTIIIGLGAMGISSAYHLAKRGKKVLGLERYTVGHENGSSHGETRITRLAYWEHPDYVPLLRRSFQLFAELESDSGGEKLFHQTGSLDLGPENEATFQGSLLSCKMHGLEHEIFTPSQLKQRFPAWSVPEGYKACFQPAGGMLFPEKVTMATGRLAKKHGAELMENTEGIDAIAVPEKDGGGVIVKTKCGKTFRGKHLILSAGAWLGSFLLKSELGRQSTRLTALASLLKPERQVVNWYTVRDGNEALYDPVRHPVWVATFKKHHYYGFPLLQGGSPGVKIGRYHHAYEEYSTEAQLNDVGERHKTFPTDREKTDEFMRNMFQSSSLETSAHIPLLKSQTCIFTNTPDEHFIVDPCPDRALPQVSLISACSGHGFKFSSVLGEVMARFLIEGAASVEKSLPIAWLDVGRFLGDRPPLQVLDPHLEMKLKKI